MTGGGYKTANTDQALVAPWRDGARPADSLAAFTIVGVDHRTTPVAVREAVAVAEDRLGSVLRDFGDRGLREGMVLSTCDRIELVHFDPLRLQELGPNRNDDLIALFAEVICRGSTVSPERLEPCINIWRGPGAVEHIFAVAASLVSQVVGEPHILGQVKQAHQAAATLGFAGNRLGRVMEAAYAIAKRVRSETSIGTRAVSMATAAVQVARDVHGNLGGIRAALLGLGEMGELLAEHLLGAGLGRLTVWHPSERRAAELASRLGAHAATLSAQDAEGEHSLAEIAAANDIVIAAFGTGQHRITAETINRALKRRRYRPIFLLDTAVPGDIDQDVGGQEDAYLYTLEDLESVAEAGLAERRAAAEAAETLVADAVSRFATASSERDAVPLIMALRDHFEAERQAVLDGLGNSASDEADRATALLAARLLHGPMERLRTAAARQDLERHSDFEAVVKWLFALDDGGEPKA